MNTKQIEDLAGHRKVSPWIVKLVQDAVMIEREACAKTCDQIAGTGFAVSDYHGGIMDGAGDCADAIRARNLDDLTSESQLRGEYE